LDLYLKNLGFQNHFHSLGFKTSAHVYIANLVLLKTLQSDNNSQSPIINSIYEVTHNPRALVKSDWIE